MTTILIVDDHPIFRMGMEELLNQVETFSVCAVAKNSAEARQALVDYHPDLAIIDISLGQENGLDLVKEFALSRPDLRLLVLSLHDESVWAERAIRAGARGYVMKKEASESVITALKTILNGNIYLSPDMTTQLRSRIPGSPIAEGDGSIATLTDRELEVFRLIGSGLGTREIAERLNLGIKTIGTYRDRIKQKLELDSGTELTRRAVLWLENTSGPKTPV